MLTYDPSVAILSPVGGSSGGNAARQGRISEGKHDRPASRAPQVYFFSLLAGDYSDESVVRRSFGRLLDAEVVGRGINWTQNERKDGKAELGGGGYRVREVMGGGKVVGC